MVSYVTFLCYVFNKQKSTARWVSSTSRRAVETRDGSGCKKINNIF